MSRLFRTLIRILSYYPNKKKKIRLPSIVQTTLDSLFQDAHRGISQCQLNSFINGSVKVFWIGAEAWHSKLRIHFGYSSHMNWRINVHVRLEEDEGLLLTPYEKNLEVWRQLWRVIERSQLVVQIVDARNPLLFRSADLEKSVKEVDPRKKNLLLINKADYLSDDQR